MPATETITLHVGYQCPECGRSFDADFSVEDHYLAKHGGTLAVDGAAVVREVDLPKTLEALYNLNKHARKYADLAAENYRRGKGGTARSNSLKKKALYGLKSAVLQELVEAAPEAIERVERHVIDGRPFYCLIFGAWSFHTPVEEWDGPELSIEDTSDLDDFEKVAEKARSDMALKDALLHIQRSVGISANDFLEETHVRYGSRRYFAGWKYLD